MRQLTTALSLLLAIAIAGCASAPRGDSTTTPAPATPVAKPEIASPVTIPEGSSRKVVMVMTGAKTSVESKDWPEFKREWRETFADHAKKAGIAFSFVDTAPSPGSDDGTLLVVNVADYRIVGIGTRIFFGIMTGNAFIDARIGFTSLRDGAKFGERQYNTTSSAAGGIFAKVTPQQVDQIAASVFTELKAAK